LAVNLSDKLDTRTLRQRCTAYVRAAIFAGSIAPGEHIIETRLADELSVSRGTLRAHRNPGCNWGLKPPVSRSDLAM